MTSLPMPSPGITAILFVSVTGQKVSQASALSTQQSTFGTQQSATRIPRSSIASIATGGRHWFRLPHAHDPEFLGYNRNRMDSVTQLNSHSDVSDSRRELTALVAGCAIYRPNRLLFSIIGRDRVRWLNGMVTNNIRDLAPGRGLYSFVLNSQGHILGDLYVFNRGESLIAEIESSQ